MMSKLTSGMTLDVLKLVFPSTEKCHLASKAAAHAWCMPAILFAKHFGFGQYSKFGSHKFT